MQELLFMRNSFIFFSNLQSVQIFVLIILVLSKFYSEINYNYSNTLLNLNKRLTN